METPTVYSSTSHWMEVVTASPSRSLASTVKPSTLSVYSSLGERLMLSMVGALLATVTMLVVTSVPTSKPSVGVRRQ